MAESVLVGSVDLQKNVKGSAVSVPGYDNARFEDLVDLWLIPLWF